MYSTPTPTPKFAFCFHVLYVTLNGNQGTSNWGRPGNQASISICHTSVKGILVFWELNEVLVILAQVFLLHFLFPQKHVKVVKHQKATIKVRRRKGEEGEDLNADKHKEKK